jgi:lipopolysaccharide transport system permease protein
MHQSTQIRTYPPKAQQLRLIYHVRTLFSYRELIYNLVLSELKARYKGSVLGFVWSLLNPLAMMLVFTVVFGLLMPNNSIEQYPIFLLCGLLPWNFFSTSIMGGTNSIVANSNLVKKVFFPREALPIANTFSNLVNFLLSFIVLFVALILFRSNFSPWLWLLPAVITIQVCFTLGIVFFLSTLNVFYRDTIIIMDVVMLAWFFLTPVFYSADMLPTTLVISGFVIDVQRLYYILNPMASIINMYRDLLYWGYRTDPDFFLRTALTCIAVLVAGYWFFKRYSGRFGEEV